MSHDKDQIDEDHPQRLMPKQSIFGWKGLGKDPTYQTSLCVGIAIIGWLMLLYALSELGVRDESSRFIFSNEEVGALFYGLCAATVLWGIVSSFFIRYPDSNTRWGARIFVGLLPAFTAGMLVYYTVI